jgi:hypothetical protein
VDGLFRNASALGFCYCQATLSREDLARLLHTHTTVALCLVDLRVLRRHRTLHANSSSNTGTWAERVEAWAWGPSSRRRSSSSYGYGLTEGSAAPVVKYLGHYVLLVGHDPQGSSGNHSTAPGGSFAYLDPGEGAGLYKIKAEALDEARFAEGTDEDLLLVQVPSEPAVGHASAAGNRPAGLGRFNCAGFNGSGGMNGCGSGIGSVRVNGEGSSGAQRGEASPHGDGPAARLEAAVTSAMASTSARWLKRGADQAWTGIWRPSGSEAGDLKSL